MFFNETVNNASVSFFPPFLQLIDITGKDQDESMIALHDCNGDVNRAINVLLEGSPDTVSIGFVCRLSSAGADSGEISATLA